jgi:hypothetical protein
VLYAADQARREGHTVIAVIEFGVAEGRGLLALEAHAAAVERVTGIRIHVYGFDSGGGMPREQATTAIIPTSGRPVTSAWTRLS